MHDAKFVIISAGSNDPHSPKLRQNLEATRAKVTGRVLWILPIDAMAAYIVKACAIDHGDAYVSFTPGRDNVHPRSYAPIAATIRDMLHTREVEG